MAQNDNSTYNNTSDEQSMNNSSMLEQLEDAKKEILDLKMQIMWMERHYE